MAARRILPFQQRKRNTVIPIPAPVLGWNKRDSLAAMDPRFAVTIQDWWPLPSSLMLRKGYSKFATGLVGQVESLLAYAGATSNKFFAAAANGNVFDITVGGAVGAAVLTLLTNGRWQYVNNTTPGGNYLQMVNGADKMRVFDGNAWHKDGDGAPYDVTGFDTSTAKFIWLFKTRIFFIPSNSLKAFYLAQNAIGGAASALDMSSIAPRGGTLVAMGTWTIDAGYGVDDLAVFVTSKGDIMVWRLTDPTTPSGIALVGVWQLGSPVGTRCLYKWAGDMLYISQDGVVPLSGALQSSRLNPRVALTDVIQSAMSDAVSVYGINFGWQLIYFPKANQLYLNVPVTTGAQQQQYVMNTITKAWCNFTGYAANCFEIFNDNLYFGANGYVGQAWNTFSDNAAQIQGTVLQAFQGFGDESAPKLFSGMRPILQTNGAPQIIGSVNLDFDTSIANAQLSFTPLNYAAWDSAVWDTDIWGGNLQVQKNWQGAAGTGYWGAPQIVVRSSGIETHWVSTDVRFQAGMGI